MRRLHYLLLFAPMAISWSTCAAADKNIVLIVGDDHGADAGCYGNPILQTPHLDALAREGVLFSKAFATTASCSASRSVILTGLHNHATGQYGHEHGYSKFSSWHNVGSLPRYLAAAGYRTGICGKFHVAPESAYHFESTIDGAGRNGEAMADNCRQFISSADERPFFLYFCFSDPHRSVSESAPMELAPNRFGNNTVLPAGEKEYSPDEVKVPPFLPDTAACRAELAEYYQSVTRLDRGIGRLIEHLKANGVYDETLIIYISDHGIAFPGAKTTAYDAGLRSPCIVRHPMSQRRGVRSDAMVSWVDICPTILEYAGALDDGALPAPLKRQLDPPPTSASPHAEYAAAGTFHGKSFLSLLHSEPDAGWDEIYASHTFHEITMYYPMRVVRERRFKLIWNIAHPLPFPFGADLWICSTWQTQYRQGLQAPYGPRTVGEYIHRPAFELYDVEKDPHESHNLAIAPAYKTEVMRLQEKLRQFQRRTDDPWILKWEYE